MTQEQIIYPKTQGYWVYAHITPEKGVYIGMSKLQPSQRWISSSYKRTALQQYIECFGWDNIEHRVLIDSLTKSQAEKIEDWFITKATADGFCINKQRSGGIYRDNLKEYKKVWYEVHREERKAYYEAHREQRLEQMNAYDEAHREERIEYKKTYRESHMDEIIEYNKAYNKQRLSTPEGRIYNRVDGYNRRHPDLAVETPMEARTKYLETGYIPSYIKNNDLI